MKNKLLILSIFSLIIFTSCVDAPKPNFEEEYQDITIINNMDQFVNFSIINGSTSATKSKEFYSQSHSYLKDWVGTSICKELLSPSGSTSASGEYSLDRMTYKVEKGSFDVTIFVCKDNRYTNKSDVYIGKMSFNFSGDKIINIESDGNIY